MEVRRPIYTCAVLLLAACCCSQAAGRILADDSCGAQGALCGASLATKCHSSGLGYCQTGLFCGWTYSDTDKKTVCMPVPKDCGKPGQSCCPGNAKAAITDPNATPKPVCEGGAYCFYTPTPGGSGWSSPPYSSPAGNLLGKCRNVDPQCGSAEGKPCCPSQYHRGINPRLPDAVNNMPGLCGGNLYCKFSPATALSDGWDLGVCVANKPDCGTFGKSCCITTSGVSTGMKCGATWGVGYCAYPNGKSTGDMGDMVCTQCPAVSVVKADPSKYFGCNSS